MSEMKERAAFTLSHSVKAELEEQIPRSKRSQFVDRAIADALVGKAKQRALHAVESAPSHSTGGQDSTELLRRLRSERLHSIVPAGGSPVR